VETLKDFENFFGVHIVKADPVVDVDDPVHGPAVALNEVAADLDRRWSVGMVEFKGVADQILEHLTEAQRDAFDEILLVDDDTIDRELFADALRDTGLPARLEEASNGAECLLVLRQGAYRPGIIFLDLNMPVRDGRETLLEIKSDKELRSIPVVILSTSNAHFDVKQSYDAGASLFVSKPHDFNQLVDMLRLVLNLGSKYVSFS
jgi:CheY-like chemotaxis protein